VLGKDVGDELSAHIIRVPVILDLFTIEQIAYRWMPLYLMSDRLVLKMSEFTYIIENGFMLFLSNSILLPYDKYKLSRLPHVFPGFSHSSPGYLTCGSYQ
jgi:hypothetical protein